MNTGLDKYNAKWNEWDCSWLYRKATSNLDPQRACKLQDYVIAILDGEDPRPPFRLNRKAQDWVNFMTGRRYPLTNGQLDAIAALRKTPGYNHRKLTHGKIERLHGGELIVTLTFDEGWWSIASLVALIGPQGGIKRVSKI